MIAVEVNKQLHHFNSLFMKRLLLFITFLSGSIAIQAQQNHVPNPSFEDMIGCPYSMGQVTQKCAQWHMVTGTPDYFNACASGTNAPDVPDNMIGHQLAAHGDAYCGIQTYNSADHMEYISAHITPLVVGQVYEVSMSVSRADKCSRATNDIGVYFYVDTGFAYSMPGMLPVTAQVNYSGNGPIHDTVNWVRLTGYFLADSAYDNMVIGPFNDTAHPLEIDTFGGPLDPVVAYYYIDSVVVRLKPAGGIATQAFEELQLYPNPNNGAFVLKGSTQTDQLIKMTVVNAIGQIVYSSETKPSQGVLSKEVNLDGMSPGIYLLRVTDNTGNAKTITFRLE